MEREEGSINVLKACPGLRIGGSETNWNSRSGAFPLPRSAISRQKSRYCCANLLFHAGHFVSVEFDVNMQESKVI